MIEVLQGLKLSTFFKWKNARVDSAGKSRVFAKNFVQNFFPLYSLVCRTFTQMNFSTFRCKFFFP